MKIEDLATTLSQINPRPARLSPNSAISLAAALAISLVIAGALIGLKPRSDLSLYLFANNYIFALKLIFVASIVLLALPVVRNISVPGRQTRCSWILSVIPFGIIAGLALHELYSSSIAELTSKIGHTSWLECLWEIPALAAPALIVFVFAVRTLAPTNLVGAGAAIGLLAGGIGAFGYALHCHDDVISFVALFYTLAILEVTLLGAVLGPRLLRWR